MAHATCSVAVVLITLLIALAAGLVNAQTYCAQAVRTNLAIACQTYLQSPTMLMPEPYCCMELDSVQNFWGSPCYCEVLVTVSPSDINMTKACTLPRDCNVIADMSNCPCAGPSPPGSAIPPPGIPTPPTAGLLTPPAGLITTPPGFTTPTVPTIGTPSAPASDSSGRNSLALPISATVGGLTGGGLIIVIILKIMSMFKIHVHCDLNAPCWCCYRRPP